MKLTSVVVLLFCVAMMFLGQNFYERGITNEEFYNVTDNLNWTNTPQFTELKMNRTGDYPEDGLQMYQVTAINILGKFVDFLGYAMIETSKFFLDFGFHHPEYDYEFALTLLKWILIVIAIGALAPLILPMIALIVVILMWLHKLIKKIFKLTKPEENVYGQKENEI